MRGRWLPGDSIVMGAGENGSPKLELEVLPGDREIWAMRKAELEEILDE